MHAFRHRPTRSTPLALLGLAVVATLTPAVPTFGQVAFNRRVEAVHVTPDPTGAPRGDIVVYYAIEGEDPSAPVDAGTRMMVFVNGTLVSQQDFPVVINPSTHSGCGGFCLSNQACFCCEVGGEQICGCGSWIAPSGSIPTPLRPEDEIMVLLRPSPGALPEEDQTDDTLIVNYHDRPMYWNRRVETLDVTRAPGTEGLYDIRAAYRLSANNDGGLRLGTELEILVNGALLASIPSDGGPDVWSQCFGDVCDSSPCAWFGDGAVAGYCELIPDADCGCDSDALIEVTLTAVPLDPGDEVRVTLRPVPGALPELPGFDEDDDDESRVPDACPEDVDGNGLVNFGDLLLVLGAWGPCAGCPEDIDESGVVDFADLLALLAKWGPCEPV